MPTIFQDRSGISLYDVQHTTGTKAPIPSTVIEDILAALLRFRSVCKDFSVSDSNIRIVATEATRNALNRDDLLREIKARTGWDVKLLAKEEEGRLGAMGIASSAAHVEGICIDVGFLSFINSKCLVGKCTSFMRHGFESRIFYRCLKT